MTNKAQLRVSRSERIIGEGIILRKKEVGQKRPFLRISSIYRRKMYIMLCENCKGISSSFPFACNANTRTEIREGLSLLPYYYSSLEGENSLEK